MYLSPRYRECSVFKIRLEELSYVLSNRMAFISKCDWSCSNANEKIHCKTFLPMYSTIKFHLQASDTQVVILLVEFHDA